MRNAFLIVAIAVAIVAGGAETHGAVLQNMQARPVHPLALDGQISGIRVEKTAVIRDARAFAALWKEHAPDSKPPAVDFSRHNVIAVFAGEKRTGGHGVRIDSIHKTARSATVTATILSPGPGRAVTMMLTYPWAMRAVPRLPGVVKINLKKGTK